MGKEFLGDFQLKIETDGLYPQKERYHHCSDHQHYYHYHHHGTYHGSLDYPLGSHCLHVFPVLRSHFSSRHIHHPHPQHHHRHCCHRHHAYYHRHHTLPFPWVRLSLCFSDLCKKPLSGFYIHTFVSNNNIIIIIVWTFITRSYQSFMMINCYV